jgi:hypothetical protein
MQMASSLGGLDLGELLGKAPRFLLFRLDVTRHLRWIEESPAPLQPSSRSIRGDDDPSAPWGLLSLEVKRLL